MHQALYDSVSGTQYRRAGALAAVCMLVATACFPWSGGEHALEGPYALYATDVPAQMELVYAVGRDAYVQRVPATVFAAGWDATHIIVKRHPGGDRTRTEYYILDRRRDGPYAEPARSVVGPLTATEFAARRAELGVARSLDFRLTLHNLE
jgi:hypothetical protein